jgi:hypothetical protein
MSDQALVRLLFVDYGSYHEETVAVPREALARHERLIDCIREEPEVLKELHVDVARLCAAHLVEAEG